MTPVTGPPAMRVRPSGAGILDTIMTTTSSGPADDTRTPMSVALVTLGCARNEVDSEELAGRLEADGFRLVADPADADTVVVNTCGFVEAAKKDSVDTLLQAADLKESGSTQAVVAVGCLAERYGGELATALTEVDAVLGLDDYPHIAARAGAVPSSERPRPRRPHDRRRSASARPRADGHVRPAEPTAPTTGVRPRPQRVIAGRLDPPPVAPLKIVLGVRPPLLVLRDPELPRGLRLPPPGRRGRRGPVARRAAASASCSSSARTRRRTAGPRRPRAPGDGAAPA